MSIEYCLKKAREIQYIKGQSRHYCILLDKRGRILAEAANSYIKTSPKMLRAGERVGLEDKIFWHAECKALYSVKNNKKVHKLIVVRVNSKGQPTYSEPCPLCSALIKDIGVKIVEYTR